MLSPTHSAVRSLIDAIDPEAYARTRNFLDGAVTCLSPYITHGIVSVPDILASVHKRQPLQPQHKLVYEFGWREYFRHVWRKRGEGIFSSLHPGPLTDEAYTTCVPFDIREGATGVPVIDKAIHTLYQTGYLHNHARMWLASYAVHVRKVHWRAGADWLYGHLLDGDLASNHLSWQWVAGTGSTKPYLFNADNVARYAPEEWNSFGTIVDNSYEALEQLARTPLSCPAPLWQNAAVQSPQLEPPLTSQPPSMRFSAPDATLVAGRDVWLVHPWNMAQTLTDLPQDSLVVGVLLSNFHESWPWSERRWRFVTERMLQLTSCIWHGEAQFLAQALQAARSVRSVDEPHLEPWLQQLATCEPPAALFPTVDGCCESFSQWWRQVTRHQKVALAS
jgi:deoxyribodipyrimidine photo-lyase